MMVARSIHLAMCTCCLFLLAGCGKHGQPLDGTVSFDGQPLHEGSINFIPQAGVAGPTVSVDVKEGRFNIPAEKGLLPGGFRVEITAKRKTGRKIQSDMTGGAVEQYEQFLPARYNRESELTADVKPGENKLEFQLLSR